MNERGLHQESFLPLKKKERDRGLTAECNRVHQSASDMLMPQPPPVVRCDWDTKSERRRLSSSRHDERETGEKENKTQNQGEDGMGGEGFSYTWRREEQNHLLLDSIFPDCQPSLHGSESGDRALSSMKDPTFPQSSSS